MGFGRDAGVDKISIDDQMLMHVQPEDLLTFGLIPEFVGRLPVVSVLNHLTEEELVSILTEPKNAMVKQYAKLFALEGIHLEFTPDGLHGLAQKAIEKGTGARALRAMLERLMLDLMYEIPSREDISGVVINRAVVEGKKQPLVRKKQGRDVA
jgi:ATP-dependent Clp protease ATP-binding subunit ClpX